MRKKMYLVIDTETCNTLEQPLCYDIGYAICDRHGKIYVERSYVVAEVFLDMKDIMQSAYYANKIPQYWGQIKTGERQIASIWKIRRQLIADMRQYRIKEIGAYNMVFDKRALNNTIRYVSKSFLRWFFPWGHEYFCIWNMACNALMATASYIKFAEQNGLISDSGNILTSAECCYRFITDSLAFEESHTGLEDVRIEIEIMATCYRTHKKIEKAINGSCWRVPQRKRKEMDLRAVFR